MAAKQKVNKKKAAKKKAVALPKARPGVVKSEPKESFKERTKRIVPFL